MNILNQENKMIKSIIYLIIPIMAYAICDSIMFIMQRVTLFAIYGYFTSKGIYDNYNELVNAVNKTLNQNWNSVYILSVALYGIIFVFIYKKTKIIQFSGIGIKKISYKNIINVIVSGIFLGAVVNISLNAFRDAIPQKWLEANQESVNSVNSESLMLTFLTVSIAAPILEEIIFRGFLYNCMKKLTRKIWISAIITSVLFGVFHGNILQGIYSMLLSFALIWYYEQASSLKASIILHGALNFSSVLASVMMYYFNIYASIVFCAIIGIVFSIAFYIECKKQRLKE